MSYTAYIWKGIVSRPRLSWGIFWSLFIFYSFFNPIARTLQRKLPDPLPILGTIKNLRTEDQYGEGIDLIQKGKVSLFLDTSNPTSEESVLLQSIQKRLRGVNLKIRMLSFTSLENASDRMELSKQLKANPFVWKFLPLSLEEVFDGENVPRSSLKSIYLVDELGHLRRKYGLSKYEINLLMIDVGLLINSEQSFKPLLPNVFQSFQRKESTQG